MSDHKLYFIPPVYTTTSAGLESAGAAELLERLRGPALEGIEGTDRVAMLAQADALEAIMRMTAAMPPADMRRHASLVLRCDDCRGKAIGWVSWVDGRPLFVGDYGPQLVMVSLLDVPEFAAPWMRCRVRSWRFMSWDFPGPGARRAERRLSHDADTFVH